MKTREGVRRQNSTRHEGIGPGTGQASERSNAEASRDQNMERKVNLAPTSGRIPGPAPAKDLLQAHKWKRGAEETEETRQEMRRKASQIATAYTKGPCNIYRLRCLGRRG